MATKKKTTSKPKTKGTKHIRFLLSPTGTYNLGYSPGDEVKDFDGKKATELIETGYAEEVK